MSWIPLFFLSLILEAVIYGPDNRQDVTANPFHRQLAKSVAVAIPTHFLQPTAAGTEVLSVETLGGSSTVFACMDERFAEQPTVGNCTGFLIGKRILLTAGHCILPNGIIREGEHHPFCDSFRWVFGYQVDDRNQTFLSQIPAKNLFSCKRILRAENVEIPGGPPGTNFGNDFAIIELDRDVTETPLKLSSREMKRGDALFAIGHPSGLPAKFSGVSKILRDSNPIYTEINLDTQGGNSGSPVFTSEGEVAGILVSGHPIDYYETQSGCYRANSCDETGKTCKENSRFGFLQVSNYIQRLGPLRPHLRK